jgi:hypothetical protein
LQGEHLVRSEHGRGVFVEPQSQNGEIDVYLLLWGMRREPCNYFEQILKLAYPPILQPGFSFTLRTVFKDSDDFTHFDQELARIESSPQIKCVLASAAQLNLAHFEKLSALSCPVVCFGESKYEEAADYPCNRIVDMADRAAACLAYMAHIGAKEASVFVPDGSIAFYKDFTRKLVMGAGQASLKLNLFEVSAAVFGELNPDKVARAYARQIDKAAAAGQLDCPIITYAMINSIFWTNPTMRERLETGVPIIEPQLSLSTMAPFYAAAFDLIRAVVESPSDVQTRAICNPIMICELSEARQYLFADGHLSPEMTCPKPASH